MFLTKLIPFESYTLITPLSEVEIIDRLIANVAPEDTSFLSRILSRNYGVKPYEGYIRGNTFKIRRVVYNKPATQPVISGEIIRYSTETRITIKISLSTNTLFSLCFGLIIAGIACLISTVAFSGPFLPPYGVLLAIWFGTLISFKVNVRNPKRFLADLLTPSL